MTGWRARLGFLVPPGNPTVEPEMFSMAPRGVSVHFSRLVAHGTPGDHEGQDARTRSQLDNIDGPLELLRMVRPNVIVMAHTASSYMLGRDGEAALTQRLEKKSGIRFTSAFAGALAAFAALGIRKVALGTPYAEAQTLQGKAALENHGLTVVKYGRLQNVRNIYEETAERGYGLARSVDAPEAEAIFLSGVGMPTVAVLDLLERDLGKPVISAAGAMMWNALRIAGVPPVMPGYGRLFTVA